MRLPLERRFQPTGLRPALYLGIVLGVSVLNGSADAQTPPSARAPATIASAPSGTDRSCPGGNGIRISLTSGDSAVDLDPILDLSRAVDTTIVFNIASRSWTRTNLAAAISVGLADEARGGYRICAGVTALMQSATLTIRGARGRLHFQASLAELTNAIRAVPGATSPQPRRL
ncbi:MAG TPA: hypothetical protein VJZ25_02100 [Gemmatimonadaceae bacterium]|nr:hypothetical protein [Gemmatimonadaceae bacterium]